MSTVSTIMGKLETLASGFKHTFTLAEGEVAVFQTVKSYVTTNFNNAMGDILMVKKPALVIVFAGSKYAREAKAVQPAARRPAQDRRTGRFMFFIADTEYGYQAKDKAAFGGGTQARGAAILLDLWRDRLALVDPKADWSLSLSAFVPTDDAPFPVDPKLGNAVVYTLTMESSWYETATA